MIPAYESFRDLVAWEPALEEARIPGLPVHANAMSVYARKQEKLTDLGGDIVSNVQFSIQPEHEPKPKDRIDGAEIMDVASVKDSAGNVLWWVAYGRR